MRKAAVLLTALAAVACSDSPAISDLQFACEAASKAFVRSPSTFDVTYVQEFDSTVVLEFDAANAYGTPVGNRSRCDFRVSGDSAPRLISFSINGQDDSETLSVARLSVSSAFLRRTVDQYN